MGGFTFDWDEDITAIPFGQRKILEIVRSMLSHPKSNACGWTGCWTDYSGDRTGKEPACLQPRNAILNTTDRTPDGGCQGSSCENIDVLVFGEISQEDCMRLLESDGSSYLGGTLMIKIRFTCLLVPLKLSRELIWWLKKVRLPVLSGSNGAGKSTMNSISGAITHKGSIMVDGQTEIVKKNSRQIARMVASSRYRRGM